MTATFEVTVTYSCQKFTNIIILEKGKKYSYIYPGYFRMTGVFFEEENTFTSELMKLSNPCSRAAVLYL